MNGSIVTSAVFSVVSSFVVGFFLTVAVSIVVIVDVFGSSGASFGSFFLIVCSFLTVVIAAVDFVETVAF